MFTFKILFHLWMSTLLYTCDFENERRNYHSCLQQWSIMERFSEVGQAGYLQTPSLMDDICIMPTGVTTDAMDTCVTQHVSSRCDSIITHWNGLKNFVKYLCRNRERFVANECRKNASFQNDYSQCMVFKSSTTKKENCRKYKNRKSCLHETLMRHCSRDDRMFLQKAFNYRDTPLMSYACKMEKNEGEPVKLTQINIDLPANTAKCWHCDISIWLIIMTWLQKHFL